MKCVHPGLGGRWWIDVMWSYSHYVESIAIIPQLILFGRSRVDLMEGADVQKGEIEAFTSHFVFAMGVSRLLALLFWCSCWRELNVNTNAVGSVLSGRSILLSQFIQIVSMGRYVYYYVEAQRVMRSDEVQNDERNTSDLADLSKESGRVSCLLGRMMSSLLIQ